MNQQLFRKKSIDRVSSPEQLDSYIRVANPGIWMVLTAIVVLLVGVCVWGVLGHLDTTASAVAVCDDGPMVLFVKAEDGTHLQPGLEVRIGAVCGSITEVSTTPAKAGEAMPEYALHVGGFLDEDWVFLARTDAQLPDGIYGAEIVVERVTPISFVMN